MLKSQVVHPPKSTRSSGLLFSWHTPFITTKLLPIPRSSSSSSLSLSVSASSSWFRKNNNVVGVGGRGRGSGSSKIEAVASSSSTSTTETKIKVKAVVTVKPTLTGFFANIGIKRGLDDITDLFGKTLLLELVSAELDPKTGLEKKTIKAYAHRSGGGAEGGDVKYEADFLVTEDFGVVGAVLVENEHHTEMFLTDIDIVLDGSPVGINVNCDSWVHSKFDNPEKRIFFTNKSYLPSQTPNGLKEYRAKELELLRGNGQGERKTYDRIYDYDTYNDIGDPDSDIELKRPVLGGKQHPYPRRCRTGRAPCKNDPLSESRSSSVYVPRDESFADVKQATFSFKALYSVLHALVPSLQTAIIDSELGFPFFTEIDKLYNEGVNLPELPNQGFFRSILPRLVKLVNDVENSILRFETPALFMRDKFSWFRDEEFARQTLAGINPHAIKLVTEWPLKSNLDPKIYGPPESAITKEIIEKEIKGFTTLENAIKEKKLFIVDYHDILLPYVHKVREIKGTTLYGSRTLFILTPDSTLKVLAIELTRPQSSDKPQWKQVFTPGWDATACWLWRLAKTHVLAHDSAYHQLVSHWLRTHCSTEPYIIATNRQLSQVHPVYRLLLPHFRYTMEINSLAREALINGGGIIESSFSPGKYSVEVSSVAYDQQWQFDLQALPADLISRGLAVEDKNAPHGLRLTIEDFPYANDGLLHWDALKQWVTDYVNHYYPTASLVESDEELQAWWTEIRTKGHADKKDEPWWPLLKTPQDLIEILTTLVWVPSGHHAAVNFGQYAFSGYFPNRPTIARTNMPNEEPTEESWNGFLDKPELALLRTFPSQIQATKIMAVLDVLSNHSPDEEYLGEKPEPSWGDEPVIKAAFERFYGRLKEIEGIIDGRNTNKDLKNRSGAGVVPYELLKPYSEPGVTAKGVPYSISI